MKLAVFATLVSLVIVACGSSLPLEDRPCPCEDGWKCCTSANLCVPQAASCPMDGGSMMHKYDASPEAACAEDGGCAEPSRPTVSRIVRTAREVEF